MILTWYNGPYIEHLTDAWWHMRHSSWLLNSNSLVLPTYMGRGFHFLDFDMSWLGVNYSSYRMQALLAWLGSSSIVESWYAATVVVCGMLGVSIFLLFYSISSDKLGIALAMLFWLILLNNMNTGFRLMGWPAGLGYVLLNLGLIASFQLFKSMATKDGWILLAICIVGMVFYHLAELYLLLVALGCILVMQLVFTNTKFPNRIINLGVILTAIGLVLALNYLLEKPIIHSVYVPVIGFFIALWLIGIISSSTSRRLRTILSVLIVSLIAYFMVDWKHLAALFNPHIENNTSYYSSYIPHYIQGVFGGWINIPKWEHQLRASILWSGALSTVLVLFLVRVQTGSLTKWLLSLTLGPAILIVSPPLFSFSTSVVPLHGGYRVQFLMPISMILGLACALGWRVLTAHRFFESIRFLVARGWAGFFYRDFRVLGNQLILFTGICLICVASINVMDNFGSARLLNSLLLGLILCVLILLVLKKPNLYIISFSVLALSILSAIPDGLTRVGVWPDRPWAVHSNLGFHWRILDKRQTIVHHTSWRYQDDLKQIQSLTSDHVQSAFISDLATSYYAAAGTRLRPLVQQPHHSNQGRWFSNAYSKICQESSNISKFEELIGRYNMAATSTGDPPLEFIVSNHDTVNYTSEVHGGACVGETEQLHIALSEIADEIFVGDHLSLWQLRKL